jgi:hypothetical protein
MAKKCDCILIDKDRNKAVGRFETMQEALKYAKQEDIKVVSFETCKGGEMHEREEMDGRGS